MYSFVIFCFFVPIYLGSVNHIFSSPKFISLFPLPPNYWDQQRHQTPANRPHHQTLGNSQKPPTNKAQPPNTTENLLATRKQQIGHKQQTPNTMEHPLATIYQQIWPSKQTLHCIIALANSQELPTNIAQPPNTRDKLLVTRHQLTAGSSHQQIWPSHQKPSNPFCHQLL